ncbi:MAG: SRPBCC family protein [Thiobacillus sp.]|nr:SRPBCC family protein [Thiobacillus sp.]
MQLRSPYVFTSRAGVERRDTERNTINLEESFMKVTVETTVAAPIETVWRAYTTPADIVQWNAASDDWHTTAASVDLREGGAFSSRMEARDGSQGFDFAGTYTRIEPQRLIEYEFGDRTGQVEFDETADGVRVRVSFDPETTFPIEYQRAGWQAILDNFARHVAAR